MIKDQRPETRDQRPETRDQRSKTRDQRPEIRDQRKEKRDQRHGPGKTTTFKTTANYSALHNETTAKGLFKSFAW